MRRATHDTTRQLTREECLHLLRSSPWGRIAVIAGDRPQIFPVNHVMHDDAILFRTGSGTKLEYARDALVAFEVDGVGQTTGVAWSVQVSGRATEITDLREILALMPQLAAPMESGAKPHVVRLDIDELSGVTFPVSPQN